MNKYIDFEFLISQISNLDTLLAGKIPDMSDTGVAENMIEAKPTDESCTTATADINNVNEIDGKDKIDEYDDSDSIDKIDNNDSIDKIDDNDNNDAKVIEKILYNHCIEYIEKFKMLTSQLSEMREFIQALCKGDLDAKVPGRRNYMAAPLKELHTQLLSLTWSMGQLAKGNIVGRLYYSGMLFESFNSLIDKVASVSNEHENERTSKEQSWEWSVNSWRYHQILSALNNLRIMVLEVSEDGKIVYANRPAKEYFGDIDQLTHLSKDDLRFESILENYLAQVNYEDDSAGFPRFMEIYDEPNNYWYKITSDRVRFSDSSTGYLHMIDNISEWKKHESSLKHTATTDPLTGVYNRGFGLQALEDVITAAKSGVTSCAAFIDLDNLKTINDLYGHNSGDYAIQTVAQALISSVRGNKDVVCRYGGDEFIIIFNNCKVSSATRAIERMNAKLEEVNSKSGLDFDVGFSHGLVEIDQNNENDLHDVIAQMDQIMYKNKAEKKQNALNAKNAKLSQRGPAKS